MAGEVVVALTLDVVNKILDFGVRGSVPSSVQFVSAKYLDARIGEAVGRFVRVRGVTCEVALDEPGDAVLLRQWCLATAEELEGHPRVSLRANAQPLRKAAEAIEEALRGAYSGHPDR
jgi:hypothetical protein